MPSNDDQATAANEAARAAGLQRLLELDPQAIYRAYALVQGFAARLPRPDSPRVEPAHVYVPRVKGE